MFLMDASWQVSEICHPYGATMILSNLVHCTNSSCCAGTWLDSINCGTHYYQLYMRPSLQCASCLSMHGYMMPMIKN
jgi:hypothetical protein